MWTRKRIGGGGCSKFFILTLSHETLDNFYRMNFNLMHHWNYSLTEIENMIPFEREIYLTLLEQHLKEEKLRQETENGR